MVWSGPLHSGWPGRRPSCRGDPAQRGRSLLSPEEVPPGSVWPALAPGPSLVAVIVGQRLRDREERGRPEVLQQTGTDPCEEPSPPTPPPTPGSKATVWKTNAPTVLLQPRLQNSDLWSNSLFQKARLLPGLPMTMAKAFACGWISDVFIYSVGCSSGIPKGGIVLGDSEAHRREAGGPESPWALVAGPGRPWPGRWGEARPAGCLGTSSPARAPRPHLRRCPETLQQCLPSSPR